MFHWGNWKKDVPNKNLYYGWTEVDHKLVAVCLGALPTRVSEDCYKLGRNDTFTRVIYNIFCIINPGGERELDCLTQYCRMPPVAADAAGVREVLEDWIVARVRLRAVGSLDMIPKERLDAMTRMVEKVCQKSQKFKTIWDTRCAIGGPGFHDHTNEDFAQKIEDWLRHELKGMESNERLDAAQQGHQRDDWNKEPFPRIMQMQAGEGGQQGKGRKGGQKEDKRKQYACYEWKKYGKCERTDCPYSHDPDTWKEYTPKGKGKGKTQDELQQADPWQPRTVKKITVVKLSVPINEVSTQRDQENDGGLLDSGASEIVRPYIYNWHKAIQEGRSGGNDVPVCLAGGVLKTGVMTYTGEVMIPRDREEVQGWILPMIRIVEELGGAVTWDVEVFKIEFPNGKVVIAIERGDGLRYVNRNDLKWIRNALVKSHFKGRHAAKKVNIYKVAGEAEDEEIED